MHTINAASAVIPGSTHQRAMERLAEGLEDPILGRIATDEVQLCPQHAGRLAEEVVDLLMETHPDTRFRIHASPRISGIDHRIVHCSNAFDDGGAQMAATAALSRRMGARGYTLHAGETAHCTLDQALDSLLRLEDMFGCRVGVEGLYPSLGRADRWLLSRWSEHERLLERGCAFAIDLSHLHIVAKRERTQRPDLVRDLVSSPNCIEVHLSWNDGRADSHRPLDPANPPWWMAHLPEINPEAVVFYEGVLLDPKRKPAIRH